VIVGALFTLFALVFLSITAVFAIRDDANGSPPGFADEVARNVIQEHLINSQSVVRQTRETSEVTTNRHDEERSDLDSFRPLANILNSRVCEYQRDEQNGYQFSPSRYAASVTAIAAEAYQHQHARRIRPSLRINIGSEEDRD
jgi:hypothetical protein